MGKSNCLAARTNASFQLLILSPFQQATAPSNTLSLLSGIIKSLSSPSIWLKPSHTGQAPYGLLNENKLGTGSSNVIPSSSNLLLYFTALPVFVCTNILPSPS